ncbi:MAG: hypothetical protein J5792_03490 [Bacteroidales bacterium]|nr:hypothetical protein [Bacteroidales bacterium]
MYKPYNDEKLYGMPRVIRTRVLHVDRESGKEISIGHIPVVEGGSHSSDRSYTPFGALEREVYYDFSSDGIVISECGEYSAAFDEHHNMTHVEYHYAGHSYLFKNQEYTFENEYDGKGRLIRQTEWYKGNGSERKAIAEFEDNGLMCCKTTYNYYKRTDHCLLTILEAFEYDDNGRLTHIIHADHSGRVTIDETREYDSDGSLSRNTFRFHDSKLTTRTTYRNATEYFISICTSYDEKKIHYRSSQLDEHGNVVAAHLHDKVSTLGKNGCWKDECKDSEYIFKYVYDEQGNWTRKDSYMKGEHYYVTREIEYYK